MIYSDPRRAALTLIESGGLSVEDLWHQYRIRGGKADAWELDAFIHDVPIMNGMEVEILRVCLNQLLPNVSKAGSSERGGKRLVFPIPVALRRVLGLRTESHGTRGRRKSPRPRK